jgi:hypothetical protein
MAKGTKWFFQLGRQFVHVGRRWHLLPQRGHVEVAFLAQAKPPASEKWHTDVSAGQANPLAIVVGTSQRRHH